ncbi:nucleotide exchange factor GrpE [Finegoldia magna]|uniref:Protein GrpE n=1 Tax=Finegoldia magna TaxID=1260 RepID=A0A2N6SUS9_FINMA|nr:nucleotide exchange factor GrpE [Finegoldia magna]MDU7384353.1 nucleotide exchange factor GrpE [Finegoldia magna]OXZ25552.1 nucleotide exchange factor GrpE [Finegoldia magna]PMC60824.1 nucleotide exchange factor GrpE [Finegoldia magna]
MKDNEENLKQSQSSEELKNEDQNLEKEDLNKNENESIKNESIKEEVDNDKDEIVNTEIEDLKDSLKRLQADFINYKNRTNRERQQSIELANESLILKILPIIDDLDRAIDSKEEKDEFSSGVELIRDNLLLSLKDFGLEEVDCSDKFDPNYHHAVITEDSDNGSDMILEVFQKGYILNNKCIRPAMVKVSK